MAIFSGLSSVNKVVIGAGLSLAVVVGLLVMRQQNDQPPNIGEVPVSLSSPSVPDAPEKPEKLVSPEAPEADSQSTTLAADPDPDAEDIKLGEGEDLVVSATVIGDTVVARADTDAADPIDTQPLPRPDVSASGGEITAKDPLKFDLVRVDKAGSAVVAGKAAPNQEVEISVDGIVVATATSDNRGGFVALFDLPASTIPQLLTLSATDETGGIRHSTDQVVVMGRQPVKPEVDTIKADSEPVKPDSEVAAAETDDEQTVPAPTVEQAPAVIIATEEGVKVVQPAVIGDVAPDVMANVTLDLISYDDEGEVVLTGRSAIDRHVRVYVDDKPVKTKAVAEDGSWQISLPEVDAGVYTLRVDEIDDAGQVTSRVETPFQKEFAEDVKRVASALGLSEAEGAAPLPRVQKITIQPGATLWALAKANYGEGNLYMQIFEANRETIRNPDLIYPGQIFTIPE